MKNVLLAITLISGFLIALFLSESPSSNEFVSDLQITLTKISHDLPPVPSELRKSGKDAGADRAEIRDIASAANSRLVVRVNCGCSD